MLGLKLVHVNKRGPIDLLHQQFILQFSNAMDVSWFRPSHNKCIPPKNSTHVTTRWCCRDMNTLRLMVAWNLIKSGKFQKVIFVDPENVRCTGPSCITVAAKQSRCVGFLKWSIWRLTPFCHGGPRQCFFQHKYKTCQKVAVYWDWQQKRKNDKWQLGWRLNTVFTYGDFYCTWRNSWASIY